MRNKRREITLIIIFSIVLIFFFSGFSIGKEFSKTTIQANAEIAEPILKVECDKKIALTDPSQKGIYYFKIKNYDEKEKITGVDLEYYVEVLPKIEKNIDLKIYKEDEKLKLNENKTQKFLMSKDKKQIDNYRIEIECNSEIKEIMQEIQIKVHSEQKQI